MAPLGINSNISSIFAQQQLGRASRNKASSLAKLSSGLQINQGRDNPAGLVISEYLRAQLGGIQQAVRNSQEAYNTLSIAEGGMNEMSSMLTRMRGLAVASLNTGVAGTGQISANQAELNGMLNTFARTADTTRYAGKPLLNGSQAIDFRASGDTQLLDAAGTRIDLVADNADTVALQFSGETSAQAERATVESAAQAGGTLAAETTFTVTGEVGSQEFTFAAGTALSDVAATVDAAAERTGVNAYAIRGDTELRLASTAYGENASVEVEQGTGDLFAAPGDTVRDAGQNATVTVKGIEIETDGLEAEVANSAFSGSFTFQAGDPAATTIAQTGYDQDNLTDATTARGVQLGELQGGMQLQLGEGAGQTERQTFGLRSMALSDIGRVEVDGQSYSLADLASGGSAALASDPEVALQVIDQAVADVAGERSRIGAYQANTLQTNINALSVAAENVTATESGIRDTNMAQEMTNFVRAQLLEQVGAMNVQSANVNAGSVLRLLGAG